MLMANGFHHAGPLTVFLVAVLRPEIFGFPPFALILSAGEPFFGVRVESLRVHVVALRVIVRDHPVQCGIEDDESVLILFLR